MGLVNFECPLKGEKKLLLEKENLDPVLKSKFTWSPTSFLNLKMWILKMRALQGKKFWIFEILSFKIKNGWRMNWPPLRNIPPSHRAAPPEIKNILTSQNLKVSKFLLSPNVSVGCTPWHLSHIQTYTQTHTHIHTLCRRESFTLKELIFTRLLLDPFLIQFCVWQEQFANWGVQPSPHARPPLHSPLLLPLLHAKVYTLWITVKKPWPLQHFMNYF